MGKTEEWHLEEWHIMIFGRQHVSNIIIYNWVSWWFFLWYVETESDANATTPI